MVCDQCIYYRNGICIATRWGQKAYFYCPEEVVERSRKVKLYGIKIEGDVVRPKWWEEGDRVINPAKDSDKDYDTGWEDGYKAAVEKFHKKERWLITSIVLVVIITVLNLFMLLVEPTQAAWTDDEWLLHIAMAEAEDEPTEGKALVMLTVLNRVADSNFPNSVADVITQRGQFTVGNRLYLTPNEDCYKALDMVYNSEVVSEGCLYFESFRGQWGWCRYLYTVGGHDFYK